MSNRADQLTPEIVCDGVRAILVKILGLAEPEAVHESTRLFGQLPEFDSLAVVELMVALEHHFGIVMDDDDLSVDVFDTVGSLADFVVRKLQSGGDPS